MSLGSMVDDLDCMLAGLEFYIHMEERISGAS